MATISTHIQGLTAAGGAAFAERWPVSAAVAASKRHHAIVTAPMPSTTGVTNAYGIARRPTEGSNQG